MNTQCSLCGSLMNKEKGDNFYKESWRCTKKGCHHAKSPIFGSLYHEEGLENEDACVSGQTITSVVKDGMLIPLSRSVIKNGKRVMQFPVDNQWGKWQ